MDRFKAGGGRIDIGTFQSVSNVILPSVVRRRRDEYPDCDIRLSEEESARPQIGELDLLFYDGVVDDNVEHVKMLDDPYLLVASAGTFPNSSVVLTQLDGAPMVAWPLTCDQPDMEQALARGSVRPQLVFRTAINDTLLSMVRVGLGSAVLEIHLHWHAGRTLSPPARRAMEIAVEVSAEMVLSDASALRMPVSWGRNQMSA